MIMGYITPYVQHSITEEIISKLSILKKPLDILSIPSLDTILTTLPASTAYIPLTYLYHNMPCESIDNHKIFPYP